MTTHPALVHRDPGGTARRGPAAVGPRRLAIGAGMLGSALGGPGHRTEALFLLVGLVWLPWASILLLAGDGRGQLAVRGVPVGDWSSVPAAVYFLWVVRALGLGTVTDWDHTATGLAHGGRPEEQAPPVAA